MAPAEGPAIERDPTTGIDGPQLARTQISQAPGLVPESRISSIG
jgi:hypothetical protein